MFSIPVGLGLIERKDQPFFAKGLLIGMTTIPVGGVIGGIVAGFNLKMVLINNAPVTIMSLLFVFGLLLIPKQMIAGAMWFGKFIVVVITVGLTAAAFEQLTEIKIFPGMAPIMEAMTVIAQIGIVLLGTFPVLHLIIKLLNQPLSILGQKLGLDSTSAACIIVTLANSIPVYKLMRDMTPRGKVINTAWLVPATAALGDHLGFTAGVKPEMIVPVVVAKLAAGILALGLAILFSRNLTYEIEQSQRLEQISS